jgi:putative OmpL-like beta-barrel porin-2
MKNTLRVTAIAVLAVVLASSDGAWADEPLALVACEPCCQTCGGGCLSGCNLGEPWTLCEEENCYNITFGGFVSSGIYANAWGSPNNGILWMKNVADGYTVDQVWGFAEKTLDTECGWDWGGRVDYLFGADAPDYQSFGDGSFDFGWNTSRDYGSAMPNLYAEVGYGDLSIKGGHFITTIGWECLQDAYNFFSSNSLAYCYAEATTHTGFLANYDVHEAVSINAGWVAGWDSGWENRNGASMLLGGATLALFDDVSLIWAFSAGEQGDLNGTPLGQLYMNSLCMEWLVNEKLTYVLQHDLGTQSGLGATPAQWYAIVNYLQYQYNDCWSVGMRAEWFRDDDGARSGFQGDLYEFTFGLNYKPHANVTIRPEIRYDWYADAGGAPFNDGTQTDQLAGGFDVIVTF